MEKATRALITGATGLIGRQLIRHFPNAAVLSREPQRAAQTLGGVDIYPWAPAHEPPPAEALQGVDVVFSLAGEPVAEGRWTEGKKQRIRESRVTGTRNLVAGFAAMDERPRVLISASAVGYYGDRGDQELDESTSAGDDFLSEVCVAWEREAMAAEELGVRVVCARIGIVLSRDGGALAKMLLPFKMGVGGRLGRGNQWMAWIHIDDLVDLLLHAAQNNDLRGALNAVAPNPVTNADFTRALGLALRRPAFLPVPKPALQVVFGEMANILTASQRAFPRIAEASGCHFNHTDINAALRALVNREE